MRPCRAPVVCLAQGAPLGSEPAARQPEQYALGSGAIQIPAGARNRSVRTRPLKSSRLWGLCTRRWDFVVHHPTVGRDAYWSPLPPLLPAFTADPASTPRTGTGAGRRNPR